jgi:ribosome-associated translation inhibitor RaiA
MQVPVQVAFRHMEPSPAADQQIRSRVAELEQFYPRIIACHVVQVRYELSPDAGEKGSQASTVVPQHS